MRIVVTGLVASFPLGGVAWDYLAYVDGFRRLGCDVLYLEDTGQWLYDPSRETFTDDANGNIRWLVDALRIIDMPAERFAVRVPDGTFYGADRRAVTTFCQSADLFLNVSGSCWLRDEYRGAKCTAYLDSDPGYTQAKLLAQERGQATDDECSGRRALLDPDAPAGGARTLAVLLRCRREPVHDGDVVEDRREPANDRGRSLRGQGRRILALRRAAATNPHPDGGRDVRGGASGSPAGVWLATGQRSGKVGDHGRVSRLSGTVSGRVECFQERVRGAQERLV